MATFGEEATSLLTGFHVRSLFSLNWNLEILETRFMYDTESE